MEQQRLYQWKVQDFLVLTIIPLELIIGNQLSKIPMLQNDATLLMLVGVAIFVLGFLVSIFLLRDFLASQWQLFKQRLWRNLILTIILAAGTFAVMRLAKFVAPGSIESVPSESDPALWLLIIAVLPAVIAAFAEELTFRYILFGKFKVTFLKLLMFFVSSVLFGLVHWNNVDGDVVRLIPYMMMGAYFALIYLFSKNIWFSILTHFIYNSSISLLPVLLLAVMQIFDLL